MLEEGCGQSKFIVPEKVGTIGELGIVSIESLDKIYRGHFRLTSLTSKRGNP